MDGRELEAGVKDVELAELRWGAARDRRCGRSRACRREGEGRGKYERCSSNWAPSLSSHGGAPG
jgi:hypothetical protein